METRTGRRAAGPARRAVAGTGAIIAPALLLGACGAGNLLGPQHEEKIDYSVTEAVRTIELGTGSGDITVVESDRSGIAVTETLRWRGGDDGKPRATHRVSEGRLSLTHECPKGGFVTSCDVDYRVEVPSGIGIRAETGSGNIVLRDLTGDIEASTGSGDIEGKGLSAKRLVGHTGSGDIEVRFRTAPEAINVETGSGDGVIRVPAGTYNVTVHTGAGDKQVDVGQDSAAPNKIVLRTGSGDAKVLSVRGA